MYIHQQPTGMSTLIHVDIPAEEFALAETLQTLPEVSVECERIVAGPSDTVMPLLWVRGTPQSAFEDALADDPTVTDDRFLIGSEGAWLYEMRWAANVQLVLEILTNTAALVLDAVGSADGWNLRVLFPDRDALTSTNKFCEAHNLTFEITAVRTLDPEHSHHRTPYTGLTDAQHETLTYAYKRGYFEIPRRVTLTDLASELEISHQALSERLRRGHDALIEDVLQPNGKRQFSN